MISERCYSCMRELPAPGAVCPHCGTDNQDVIQRQLRHALPCGTELVDKYTVGKVLGQGGFGITYIGWNDMLETRVCIKEYFPDGAAVRDRTQGTAIHWYKGANAARNRQGYESFLTEARKAARLRDLPSVVKVWDVFQANETAYIVMDFIDGVSLKDHLVKTGKPLTEAECVEYFGPVMTSLAEVHKRGIIHRDISPDNLMLRPDGKLVLLDLGAAKDLNNGSGQSSFVVARRGFSPLEQYTHKSEIGPWTDVYALCATILYCVTGKLLPEPLERYSGKTIDMSGFSPDFSRALERGLVIEPGKRTQSMESLLEQLEAAVAVKEQPSATKERHTGLIEKRDSEERLTREIVQKQISLEENPAKEPRTEPKKRKNGLLPLFLVLITLLLAAGGLFFGDSLSNTDLIRMFAGTSAAKKLIGNGLSSRDAGRYSEALEYFIQAVEHGDASAMDEIGTIYALDRVVVGDEGKAFERFIVSADSGNSAAMTAVGDIYALGLGVKQDSAKAQAWYKKATDAGNTLAMVELGALYQDAENYAAATELYQQAAKLGQTSGMTHLAHLYSNGLGVDRNPEKALEWLRKAEKKGDAVAMAQLGYMYYDGLGVAKDYGMAADCYSRSAQAGESAAMLWLGKLYQDGSGVKEDCAEALNWYQKAFTAGEASAANLAGSVYQIGSGVKQDYEKAMEWYRIGANVGDPAAMNNLGYLYQNALGCKQDYDAAVEWYRKSIEAGGTPAMAQLGYCYLNGLGVKKDFKQARELFLSAADKGNTIAMYYLGEIYQNGKGVKTDKNEALKWYQLAANDGYLPAAEKLRELDA